MTKLQLIALIPCATLLATPAAVAAAPAKPTTPGETSAAKTSGRVQVLGVDYYYEVRGDGEPLLLLHGGLGSGDMFGPVLPLLTSRGRQVITVDLQGHGRTNLGDRPLRCETIADDVVAVLTRLGRSKVDVLGYSFGSCVALRLAVQHPDKVRRLVLASAPFANDGWYPEMVAQQKQVSAALAPAMKDTPMYTSYKAVAPKDEFPRLLDAMGDLMRQTYDYSAEVARLKMPVMLVFGDADMVRPEHEIKFYQLLGGGLKDAGWNRENMPRNRLAIVPDVTHYELFSSPRLAETVLPFLSGQSGAQSWAAQVKAPPRKSPR
jgi:pimeloyl-ACP methyl ester carboxylesterase